MITLLAITAIIFLALKSHSYYWKMNAAKIADELKQQAENHGFLSGKTLIRKNWGLALDTDRSQLLYVSIAENKLCTTLLYLSKVKYCNIRHTYSQPCSIFSIRSAKNKKHLDSILLNIQYTDNDCQIAFYSHGSDELSEMKMLSRQARQWQRIINNQSVFHEICKS